MPTAKKTTKKTTTKKTTAKTTTKKAEVKKTEAKTTKKTSKKKVESAVPEIKKVASEIIPNAYGLDKFKDWVEEMSEVTCKQIKVKVTSSAGRSLHDFQIKLYLRELAEKNGVALTDLKLEADHFEFTLIQPIEQEVKEIKI